MTKHDVNVTHRVIDPDAEALEELRALRSVGTSREKLVELFGQNGLAASNAWRPPTVGGVQTAPS